MVLTVIVSLLLGIVGAWLVVRMAATPPRPPEQ